jgi:heme/copper-type cytochrome/quinol oxidase subunit 2
MKKRVSTAWLLSFAILVGCRDARKEARVIHAEMKKYAVIPAEIRVKQGEAVVLEVTTPDVQHGFDVPGLGIKESIQPGKPARFSIPTERKGRFEVVCGIICGARHEEMRGAIIVE